MFRLQMLRTVNTFTFLYNFIQKYNNFNFQGQYARAYAAFTPFVHSFDEVALGLTHYLPHTIFFPNHFFYYFNSFFLVFEMFCNIFLVLVLILIFVLNIECDNSNPSSKNPRVIIDKLTEDVIKSEKHLLAQLSSKQLQYERGQLLDEVYRIYLPFYTTPIGDHQSIRSVGFQRVKDLIDNVILVDSNRRNFRASLATQQYDVTNEIAHNALDQMINSADGIYQSVSKRIFWQNIINQVSVKKNNSLEFKKYSFNTRHSFRPKQNNVNHEPPFNKIQIK